MSFEYLNELNKQQREAATYIEGPLRIIAGAGSGKTKTLITRVAYMVDKGINPEHILLITFTNNAANEMLSRASKLCFLYKFRLLSFGFSELPRRHFGV